MIERTRNIPVKMPFKFLTTLDSASSKSLWTRSIYALSTASDVIKITLRQANNIVVGDPRPNYSELLLTAINITKTSSLNCSFRSNFFSTFKIDGYLPDEAITGDCNIARCFSILVNSKTLNVLFKDCGENSETFKLLLIHEDSNSKKDRIFSNKLFIELETKTGMTKRYSVNFRIGKESFDLRVEHIYLEMLRDQSLSDDVQKLEKERTTENPSESDNAIPRVHKIVLETSILRNFIAMFSNALEDFKIEIYSNARKMQFHGFNRQKALSARTKITPLSNQPMSLSIQMSLNDLIYDNIPSTEGAGSKIKEKFQVSFRLRYMRTFIQLIGNDYAFHASSDSSNQPHRYLRDMLDEIGNNYCEILLIQPSFPTVFSRKYRKDDNAEDGPVCCQITLITATDSETDKVNLDSTGSISLGNALDNSHTSMKKQKALAYLESVRKLELVSEERAVNTNEALFVPFDGEDFESDYSGQQDGHKSTNHSALNKNNVPTRPSNTGQNLNHQPAQHEEDTAKSREVEDETDYDSIFWDNVKYHRAAIKPLEIAAPSINMKGDEEKKHEEEEDHYNQLLGPTQKNTFKGVFGS